MQLGSERCQLPADASLLPLRDGQLLVSRSHAVFCHVPAADVAAVRQALAGRRALGNGQAQLLDDLDRHGFFGLPRPMEEDPPTVGLQLTDACDCACAYCCTNSGEARKSEVTFDQLLEVVDQIGDLFGDRARVALLGGEPFLVPWAVDLAGEVLERGLNLTIFSNGILLADTGLAKQVAALTCRGAELRVSLSGPNSVTCDAVSGVHRFDKALAGLHGIAQAGGSAAVDLMLLPQHVDSLAAELPELRRKLPTGMTITFGVLYRSGRETGAHMFESATQLEAALDRIAFEAGETIPAVQGDPLAFRREGCDCALGRSINVRSDGALFACFKMEEQIGHLDSMNLAEALQKLRDAPQLAASLPRCAECSLATLCGGGCRSENLLMTGHADEPVCDTWRVQVLSELLAEDRVAALGWPAEHLLAEAHRRGIDGPPALVPQRRSTHLLDD